MEPAETAQPRPRPDRSAEAARRVRVQNRRLEFLRRNPAYVASVDREFVNVGLYHALVRSFQTPAERAAEAQDSGFGHVLEASMLRNPEPLQRADDDDVVEEEEEEEDDDDGGGDEAGGNDKREEGGARQAAQQHGEEAQEDAWWDALGDGWDGGEDDVPPREAALRRWHAVVRGWFVAGGAGVDEGFDYTAVDDDSDYDALARADAEDRWFDEEEPAWAEGDGAAATGETGIQDF